MTQYSISWDFQQSFCSGLSSFQQNGEFVDMTLAADGHYVKVHQLVLAMSSPYIKELIASAECPHPVIFLNKISYKILSALLEYIYTGQVQVSFANLNDLINAGKELHIRGIENVKIENANNTQYQRMNMEDEVYFEVENITPEMSIMHEEETLESSQERKCSRISRDSDYSQCEQSSERNYTITGSDPLGKAAEKTTRPMQYTVSNQGSIQMILNRFMYYLKYTNRNRTRQWRCVDYINKSKCPAYVVTKDNIVLKRVGVHKHPFHDKRILKKLSRGAVFTGIDEAELEGHKKKTIEQTKMETQSTIETHSTMETQSTNSTMEESVENDEKVLNND